MKTYRVYELREDTQPIVVKVGFSWGAFLFGPLWFLANRMWLNFIIVASLLAASAAFFINYRPVNERDAWLVTSLGVLYLIVWFCIGRYANYLLGLELETRGYKLKATVTSKNLTDARDTALQTGTEAMENEN